jgi:hypothetical protein
VLFHPQLSERRLEVTGRQTIQIEHAEQLLRFHLKPDSLGQQVMSRELV